MPTFSTPVDALSTGEIGKIPLLLYCCPMNLGGRIKQRLEELGWSQADLLGYIPELNKGALSALITRDSKRSEFAPPIAEALGVNLKWLMSGEGTKLVSGGEVTISGLPASSYKGKIVPIPMMAAKGSMGLGMERPEDDTVIGNLPLSEHWIRRNLSVTSPANLATISAYGDSMSPTFNDGDILLVDRGIHDLKLDAVYVIDRNGELFVKRVQRRMDGSLVIKSDNPLYDPHIVTNGEKEFLRVLGRVLWSWNGKKL